MRCPFLRDEQVKSCMAVPFRTSIARSAAQAGSERCSSRDYVRCPALRPSVEAHPSPARCPFLRESLAQFCAAAPRPAYVPWSDSQELRCASDAHRFCELFLGAGGPEAGRPAVTPADADAARIHDVAGVPMPGWLFYAESHLWLDVGDGGVCHVGIDALLAQLLGCVDRLAFEAVKGTRPPAVVLTVRGLELALRFPRPLALVSANTRLRAGLERLTADPYGAGWLFQVRLSTRAGGSREDGPGLRHGRAARAWMESEVRRVSERVHACLSGPGARVPADGGRFAPGLLQRLGPDVLARFWSELFPTPDPRRTP